jgi:hypothetical protein
MSINTKRNRTALVCLVGLLLGATQLRAQDVLPFPETPTASTTGKTLADSKHQSRKTENHLPKDAPNIVIFMTDDAGFSHPEVFGGPVHMPTMARLAESGISYNAFHTTAMCSPTRASLLTGRNHHRVGNGSVAETATDWDGYVGKIPKVHSDLRRGTQSLRLQYGRIW